MANCTGDHIQVQAKRGGHHDQKIFLVASGARNPTRGLTWVLTESSQWVAEGASKATTRTSVAVEECELGTMVDTFFFVRLSDSATGRSMITLFAVVTWWWGIETRKHPVTSGSGGQQFNVLPRNTRRIGRSLDSVFVIARVITNTVAFDVAAVVICSLIVVFVGVESLLHFLDGVLKKKRYRGWSRVEPRHERLLRPCRRLTIAKGNNQDKALTLLWDGVDRGSQATSLKSGLGYRSKLDSKLQTLEDG